MTEPIRSPRALLLDFGGVIVSSEKPAGWQERVAHDIRMMVGEPDALPEHARVVADVRAGAVAASLWRNAMSRPMHPAELDPRTYVLDFLAADWPGRARAALEPHVAAICYAVSAAKEIRTLRDGIVELLEWARERRLPVAIVSNALSGQVHRDVLREAGLSSWFAAELYSDEEGIRKPNPDFLLRGAAAVGARIDDCWYVGDHLDRDVLCGVRAGVGANVLMPAPGGSTRPYTVPVEADIVVSSPRELWDLLKNENPPAKAA
ncbi:MAG TPA: HAD family hydrolase [Candidatus Microbacterium stercoravium]|uniref:HAD family hydrolase n=1 Tax=Candidatus Microbacterium stercoravium TaxID=2838697 RepID=A0A9D2H6D7_9MICO|nr:HAD family hydrolase [Candidatus Microbacterium stercoravium]